ncbi:MAG: hypothetical protein P4L22_03565 [Candidatus Babeliales bacterium]|nr:hypothetical protein [Candidatus Babeliales bacterium]
MNFFNKCLLIMITLQIALVNSTEFRGRGRRERGVKKEIKVDDNSNQLLNHISSTNVKSLPAAKSKEKVKRRDANKQIMDPYARLNQLEETITNTDPATIRQRSFAIIADAEKQLKDNDWTKKSVVDKTTLNDLNILVGPTESPDANLAAVIGKDAFTDIGKAYLTTIIARPTDDIELLQKRQQIIKDFNDLNEDDFNAIQSELQEFGSHENYLIGLWGENLAQLYPQKDYFSMIGASYLNESSKALQAKSYLENIKTLTSEGVKAMAAGLLILYGISSAIDVDTGYNEAMSSYANRNLGSVIGRGSGISIPKEFSSALTYIEQPQIRGAMFTAAGYNAAKMLKTSLQQRHAELLQHNTLLKRVMHIAQLIISMEKIRDRLRDKPTKNLLFFSALNAFFDTLPKEQKKIDKLFELLKSDTFAKEADETNQYVYNYGKVLVATKLLTEIEEHIALPMAAIAEIDTFMTFANLIKTSKNSKLKYCYPNFIINSTPELYIDETWNPFVNPEKVIANSVTLNKNVGENIVLTGPNSGGKSTILKNIAIDLILIQSAAIAPGKSIDVTPFSNISTYMNVSDKSVGTDQASLFQAEVDRVLQYGDIVRKLKEDNKFSFAIFDEIFSGTNPEKAINNGLKIAKGLIKYGNNMSIISTHFKELAIRLEEETGGKYKNYKVTVEIHPDGTVKRLYKLEPGISDQDIADIVFKERGKNSPFFNDIAGQN